MARQSKSKKGRKQCTVKKCRKLQVEDGFCAAHIVANNPVDNVTKLTELERLRFLELDNNMLTQRQELKILEQAQRIEDVDHSQRKAQRQHRVNELNAGVQQHMREQRTMLVALGEKYGFDPVKVSIDDKTGVIQEHKTTD